MVSPYSKHYLRFPVVFGGILTAFIIGFSYRREIFSKDLQKLREENRLNEEKWQEVAEEVKRISRDQFARERERLAAARKN